MPAAAWVKKFATRRYSVDVPWRGSLDELGDAGRDRLNSNRALRSLQVSG